MKPRNQLWMWDIFCEIGTPSFATWSFRRAWSHSLKPLHRIMTTCLQAGKLVSQVSFHRYSLPADDGKYWLHSFFFPNLLRLVNHWPQRLEPSLDDTGDESMLYGPPDDVDDFFCLPPLFRLSSRGLTVFSALSVATLRCFTSITGCEQKRKLVEKEATTHIPFRKCRIKVFTTRSWRN